MSKLLDQFVTLQPQEVILGLFGEYVNINELPWSGGLVSLLGDLGFQAPSARLSLNRVIARGLLSPNKQGRLVFDGITPQLELILKEGRRRTFPENSELGWTGKWTFVWYSIPEKRRLQRARLGRWLDLGGFGSLQDGTWIAPGDNRENVYALLKRLDIEEYVTVFFGELGFDREISHLARNAWKIDDLTALFELFLSEMRPFLEPGKLDTLDGKQQFVTRTKMIEMFRKIMVMDPKIPDHILGVDWQRREAIETFLTLQKALFPGANQHFREFAMAKSQVSDLNPAQ